MQEIKEILEQLDINASFEQEYETLEERTIKIPLPAGKNKFPIRHLILANESANEILIDSDFPKNAVKNATWKDQYKNMDNRLKPIFEFIQHEYCRYNKSEQERGLILDGVYGTGKTCAMILIAKLIISRFNISVAYSSSMELIRAIFDKRNDVIRKFKTAHISFLDDFGFEGANEFSVNEIMNIIKYRDNLDLPFFVATNRNVDSLGEIQTQTYESDKQIKDIFSNKRKYQRYTFKPISRRK